MAWTRENRKRFANALIVIGALLTVTFFGMAFGIPLMIWGWDVKRRLREEAEESRESGSVGQKASTV